MINYIFRNKPKTHPVLSEIAQEKEFTKMNFLGLTFYTFITPNNSQVCIDDPLAILLVLKNKNFRKMDIIFYSLELYEKQIANSTMKNMLRNIIFYVNNYIAQKKAKVIIFPSKLRLNYFKSRAFVLSKSCIIYNKPDFSSIVTKKLSDETKKWINNQRLNNKKIIVFAGALQSGRSIDKILDNLDKHSKYSLVLAGPIIDKSIVPKIKDSSQVLYLGTLKREDVFALYKEVDFGLLTYDNSPKNAELCAPIKIWEYNHFGLKILANKNHALLTEWAPLIDGYFDNYKLDYIEYNSAKSNKLDNIPSMSLSFNKLISEINL